jgi:hypothetical protein
MASQSFQLVMHVGPNPGKVYELSQDEVTIGRDIGNTIVINDPEVSRRHARLTAQAGGYVLEDLGSTNGTFVDGQRLMGPHMLRSGETIMLGEKINLGYEPSAYDPNATLVGGALSGQPAPPASKDTYRVTPSEENVYTPPPQQAPYPASPPPPIPRTEAVSDYPPAYSGQVPPGPAEPYVPADEPYAQSYDMGEEEEKGRSNRNLIIAGCGCLLVLVCVCVIAAYAFDSANLYCTDPFNIIFGDLLGLCN